MLLMSTIPISKTKIIPPRRRAELLTRKRLLDALFDSLDKRLTLVSAPAGYGKTSLLIDLAHASELPCCWLALDELDREPRRFAAYFIAALSERFPKFGSQSKSALDTMTSFEGGMERLLVTLINELYDRVPEHFIFVLDDFHLVEDVSPIQTFINRFVHLVDDNCHLVIASRKVVALPDLPLLVAREQVSGLDFADLAFLPGEIQALLAQNKGLRISDEEASQLAAETEGWITGLQFSDIAALRKHPSRAVVESGARLFEYLGQQVLDRQPADVQEFILRTSLMDEFDASLCEAALAPLYRQPQDWEGWMRLIARSNVFALPVGEGGRWLRYHNLFRDFIRARFERERPHEMKPILLRLQRAYESMGEWERAYHICRRLGDAAALAELIERASTSMLQNAHLTVEAWLNELPPSLLRTRPGLLSIRGAITYTKGDLQGGLSLLNDAEKIVRSENRSNELALTLSRRATVYRFLGEYENALRDADEVIRITEGSDGLRMLYAEALRIKGVILYRLGQARHSVAFLEKSLDIYHGLHHSASIPVLWMETGMAYRALGNFAGARSAYEKALQIWRREGNLFWQATLLNNLGVLYHFAGEYEQAALTLEEGLLCAQRSRYARMEGLISIGIGDLFAELEDFDTARQNYQHAADILKPIDDHFLRHSLTLAQANLALLQSDALSAQRSIEEVADAVGSGNSNYENGALELIYGRIHLLEGNLLQARASFERAERRFIEDGRQDETAAARVWLAAAHSQDGSYSKAEQILSNVHPRRGKIIHAAVVAAHQARQWLAHLPVKSVERAVRDLLAEAARFADQLPALRRQLRRQTQIAPAPPPRLNIQGFGQALVFMDGNPVSLSDWQTQSVRELFFYLLAAPKPLTKEQIGEALWREVDEPAKLRLRFKNEIYRLRRAIGQDVVLFQDARYAFNRALDYEYDVEAFEAFLRRAKSAANPSEQIAFYQKAVDFVRGPYLNDIYADWVVFDRERLGQAYLNALVTLANLYKQHAQYENAIAVCQKAIASDPGCEAAFRIAMETYHRLGDRASVTRMYQACRAALQDLFQLPPSRETEELYRRLL